MYLRLIVLFFIASAGTRSGCAQLGQLHKALSPIPAGRLIFEERFDKPLDTVLWKMEIEPSPGSKVETGKGKLILQTGAGVTVWLNKQLNGNIMITYRRKVLMRNGKFDRLSDLNQFWMASDPRTNNLFTRTGKFEEYDNLLLYYVGMGGNTNTTTRFRRYDGNNNRELMADLTDQKYLLKPNKEYLVKTVVNHGEVSFWVDNQLYFSYKDTVPITSGYFGFRSTKSNQEISGLKIYELP